MHLNIKAISYEEILYVFTEFGDEHYVDLTGLLLDHTSSESRTSDRTG
jgi:hypothetical protein